MGRHYVRSVIKKFIINIKKHPYDCHLTMFTKEKMEECLREARFYKISFKEDINKIKVSCYK